MVVAQEPQWEVTLWLDVNRVQEWPGSGAVDHIQSSDVSLNGTASQLYTA